VACTRSKARLAGVRRIDQVMTARVRAIDSGADHLVPLEAVERRFGIRKQAAKRGKKAGHT